MKDKEKKTINYLLILLLLVLLVFQFIKIENNLETIDSLQVELLKEQLNNERLEQEYIKEKAENINLNKKEAAGEKLNLKEMSSDILNELRGFNLKLIDFSSSEAELNLNLNGDFNSILDFINLIESKSSALLIKEFKLKRNAGSLFLFLKLNQKNEKR